MSSVTGLWPVSLKLIIFNLAGMLGILLILLYLLTADALAATGINKQINFQGKVVNSNGTNVANGSYSFTFKIYSVASAGSALWTDTETLTVTNGIFQYNLGSDTVNSPLPGSLDFNSDNLYLGITFNNDAAGEMTPRIRFTSVPQAFNSEKVGGKSLSELVQLTPGSQQAGSINVSGNIQTGGQLQGSTAVLSGATSLTVGTSSAADGSISFRNSANANTLTLKVGTTASDITITLPGALGVSGDCLKQNSSTGALHFAACASLQQAYDASGTPATITTTSTTKGVVIAAGAGFDSDSLLKVQNAGGTPLLIVDSSNSRIIIGSSTADTIGTLLVLDTKTDAGDPAGVNGAMYYNSGDGKFRCYEAGAWKNCITVMAAPANHAIMTPANGTATWTDQPAALTELFGSTAHRAAIDMTSARQGRLVVNVETASAALGADLCLQYSTDGTTWSYLDGSSGPCVGTGSVQTAVSAWVNLAAGAKADVKVRVAGKTDGSSTGDPVFGAIHFQIR